LFFNDGIVIVIGDFSLILKEVVNVKELQTQTCQRLALGKASAMDPLIF